jgi:hypothetical protein
VRTVFSESSAVGGKRGTSLLVTAWTTAAGDITSVSAHLTTTDGATALWGNIQTCTTAYDDVAPNGKSVRVVATSFVFLLVSISKIMI